MKKKSVKLELRKMNVSKLSSVRGAGPKEVETLTKVGDACCIVIDPYETQLTTCYSGAPNCDDHTDNCYYTYRCWW